MDNFAQIDAPTVAAVATVLATAGGFIAWKAISRPRTFLVKGQKKTVKIEKIEELSHDTKLFRLSLGKGTVLGLPIGKHIKITCGNPEKCRAGGKWNGRDDPDMKKDTIDRAYTPTSGNQPGYTDLVIKIYRPGTVKMPDGKEVPWEDGGKMGLYLDTKKPGDTLEIMGPVGMTEYLGKGKFSLMSGRKEKVVKKVGMLSGGTGLTPMLQVVQAALADPADRCEFSLIYANKTENDILCRDMLEAEVAKSGGRFKVYYTLDFPPPGWSHLTGFITADMIQKCLPPPGEDTLVLMCGPPPMVQYACKQNLDQLGYSKDMQVAF